MYILSKRSEFLSVLFEVQTFPKSDFQRRGMLGGGGGKQEFRKNLLWFMLNSEDTVLPQPTVPVLSVQ